MSQYRKRAGEIAVLVQISRTHIKPDTACVYNPSTSTVRWGMGKVKKLNKRPGTT